ncbi:MAG: DNA repair protein RecO (recombination protein O) [Arenicella sp.]|jgi:DNA repair protein RecO (recombination protein O)
MRVHQQAAYVLINRPYSESSWIVEIFSREYGRMALMAKGARRIKSQLKGVLLPFQPVLLSWVGKGEIPTLTSAEIDVSGFNLIENDLQGDQLVSGFYCNELLVYLLHRHDPHPQLFDRYHSTIIRLYDPESVASEAKLAATLRKFEQIMLKETGYEVSFEKEADGKSAIQAEAFYQFQPGQGFVRSLPGQAKAVGGNVILAMQVDWVSNPEKNFMTSVKHLMRDILKQSLGYQKIHSRELFFPKSR